MGVLPAGLDDHSTRLLSCTDAGEVQLHEVAGAEAAGQGGLQLEEVAAWAVPPGVCATVRTPSGSVYALWGHPSTEDSTLYFSISPSDPKLLDADGNTHQEGNILLLQSML